MSDTTPTSLEAILRHFYMDKRADQALPEAIAAIQSLIPEKDLPLQDGISDGVTVAFRAGKNAAIDTIHRNFTGQTDNEREDSRI